MKSKRNPQAEQMGDESMARNLAHQAEAIWPQEQHLFDRYGAVGSAAHPRPGLRHRRDHAPARRALSAMRRWSASTSSKATSRSRAASAPRSASASATQQGDAFALASPTPASTSSYAGTCRRRCRISRRCWPRSRACCDPGGWLHLLSEDYGMLQFPAAADGFDPDRFWNEQCDRVPREHRLRRSRRPAFAGAAAAGGLRRHRDGLRHRRYAAGAAGRRSPASSRAWRDGYTRVARRGQRA